MKSKDLAAANLQCQPQPLLIGLFAYEATELLRFGLQGMDPERIAALGELNLKMGRCRLIALDSESPSAISCPRLRHGRCRVGRAVPAAAARASARCSLEIRRWSNSRPQALHRWF